MVFFKKSIQNQIGSEHLMFLYITADPKAFILNQNITNVICAFLGFYLQFLFIQIMPGSLA